jgi:uncharacterized coiled-coil protein SlyX
MVALSDAVFHCIAADTAASRVLRSAQRNRSRFAKQGLIETLNCPGSTHYSHPFIVQGVMPQSLEERVAYLEGRVSDQIQAQNELRELVVQLNQRVDHLDRKIDRFREGLANRIDALDDKVSRQFVWLVGIQVTVLIAVVSALSAALLQ